MPTFNKREDVKLYGLPIEIDGIPLSDLQACKVLPGIVDRLMDEAEYEKGAAFEKAIETFRAMYVAEDGRWKPKRKIALGKGHGKSVRNKYYDREKDMARGKGKKPASEGRSPAERLVSEMLSEAGARNSKRDLGAIKEVVKLALSQMSKEDGIQALKDAGYRLKEDGSGR